MREGAGGRVEGMRIAWAKVGQEAAPLLVHAGGEICMKPPFLHDPPQAQLGDQGPPPMPYAPSRVSRIMGRPDRAPDPQTRPQGPPRRGSGAGGSEENVISRVGRGPTSGRWEARQPLAAPQTHPRCCARLRGGPSEARRVGLVWQPPMGPPPLPQAHPGLILGRSLLVALLEQPQHRGRWSAVSADDRLRVAILESLVLGSRFGACQCLGSFSELVIECPGGLRTFLKGAGRGVRSPARRSMPEDVIEIGACRNT